MERSTNPRHEFGLPDIGIPFEILFHPKLTNTEKILYGFIRNLAHGENGCYATNGYLGGLMGFQSRVILKSITTLRKYKIIIVEHIIENKVSQRRIFINPEYTNIYQRILSGEGGHKYTKGDVQACYPSSTNMLTYSYTSYKNEDVSKEDSEHTTGKFDILIEETYKYFPSKWRHDTGLLESLKSYFTHRKQKRATPTLEAAKRMAMNLSKYTLEIATASLIHSVENGWTGVFPDKMEGASEDGGAAGNPEDIVNDNFNSSYAKVFYGYYLDAEGILTEQSPGICSALAHNMVKLRDYIKSRQTDKAQLNGDIPTAGGLIKEYVVWLEEQNWIDDIEPNIFKSESKIFKRFIKSYSSNIGIDVMRGAMV